MSNNQTPAYNDFLLGKINTNDRYDKGLISREQWERTIEGLLCALYNAHPRKAKREAKAMGLNDIKWPE